MNKLITCFFSFLFLIVAVPQAFAADEMDDQFHPVMYLRGEMTNWAVNNDYKFTRDGNDYTITVPSLDGAFKISGTEWNYNFGAASNENRDITTSIVSTGTPNGPNYQARNLTNLTVKFSLSLEHSFGPTAITFIVDGQEVGDNTSGTLPVLHINVYTDETHTAYDNEVISYNLAHKNYFSNAEYWLDLNGCDWMGAGAKSIGSAEEPLPLEIKARGNWTRTGFSKKPFKLKLGKKQSMLGMTKSKHYAILAHADDNYGYLRNFVGFNLGKRIGLPWTPDQQPIEVIINGDYRGLYFLTESIRVGDDRVMIEELYDNETDPALCSGGYLVELDNYDEENQIRMEEKTCIPGFPTDMLRITWDTPEEYSSLQRQFVTDQFAAMNDAVGANSDVLWSYMDLDDAVRYYIVEEIISHREAYHGSTYLFRDRGENQKWHFSPLWDCGNAFTGATDRFFYEQFLYGTTWIPSMRCNNTFNAKLRDTWAWFMTNKFDGLYDEIDAYVESLKAAALTDYTRWHQAPVPNGGSQVIDNRDMDGRKAAAKERLVNKINWLRTQFGDYTTMGTVPEPERDNTPAAPLPDYVSGVENVTIDSSDAPVEYYNLQGMRVSNPGNGIYIRRQGDNAVKVVL